MRNFSRRAFLRAAVRATSCAAAAGLLEQLSACAPQGQTPVPATMTAFIPPSPTAAPTEPAPAAAPTQALPANTPAPTAAPSGAEPSPAPTTAVPPTEPAPTAAPQGAPDLVAARGPGASESEPDDLVRRAIAALGGIEKFVPKGSRVVVKPNICTGYFTYEYAATTNPVVVAALVKLCLEAGASTVQVFDYPFGSGLMEAYAKSGIQDAVKASGGDMTPMAGYKYVEVEIPNGKSLKKTKAYKDALEADVLINVPIAKHHSTTRLTLGMKNLMGIIQNRSEIHSDINHRIPDLAALFRPTLTVVDAVRILTAHGPTGGSLDDVKKLDTVIASADFVAADAYAATLFDIEPQKIPYIAAAAEAGLGRMDLESLRIEQVTVGG